MSWDLEAFLREAEGRSLERLLELDLDWKPLRLESGRLRLAPGRRGGRGAAWVWPPCAPFRRSRAWRKEKGLGPGSEALRELEGRLRRKPGDFAARLQRLRLLLVWGRAQEAFQDISLLARGRDSSPLLRAAEAALSLGDARQARVIFNKCLEVQPGDAWAWAWRSEARRAGGDVSGARADMDAALAISAHEADLWVLSGRLGRPSDYDRALALAPDSFWALGHRGWARLSEGRPEQAVKDFGRLGDRNPRCAWVFYWRALAREEAGDSPGAVEDHERAILLDPAAIWSYSSRAKEIGTVTDWAAVLESCEESLKGDPADGPSYALRAECRDQHELVMTDLRRAAALCPERAWIRALVARMLAYRGQSEEALAEIEAAIGLWPRCGWLTSWRGDVRRGASDARRALEDQSKALELSPEDSTAYAWRGGLRRAAGFAQEALADLDAALELGMEDASWAHLERARALRDLGNLEAAREDFHRARQRDPRADCREEDAAPRAPRRAAESLKRDPWLAEAHAMRARLACRRGRVAQAVEELEIFRILSPKDWGSSLERAALLRRLGLFTEALGACERALRMDPGNCWAYQEMALCRLEMGDIPGAYQDQREAQRHDEGQPFVFGPPGRALAVRPNRLEWVVGELDGASRRGAGRRRAWRGFLRLEQGRLEEAERDFHLAARAKEIRPWVLSWLAELKLNRGRAAQAQALLDRAARHKRAPKPVRARLWALRGEAWSRQGRPEEALRAYDRALALDGQEKLARLGRARLLEEAGRWVEALADLEAAGPWEPRSAWLFHWRGRLLSRLGRPAEAEIELSRALEIHPGYSEALRLREELRAQRPSGRLESAARLAREGLFLESLRVLGQETGRILEGVMDFDIIFDAEQVISLDGRDRPSCDAAGLRSACGIIERAKGLPEAAWLAWLLEGAAMVCAGRFDEALASLEKARSLAPGEAWVAMWRFRARCRANFMAGKTYEMQEALKHLDEAIRLDPRNPHAYAWRARCLKAMSFVPRALADIDRVLELRPDYDWARAIRGNLRAEAGLARQAMDDCAELMAHFSEKSWAWAQRARVRARCGQTQDILRECLADMEAALRLEPQNSMYYGWKGEVERLLGLHAQAEADFRRSAALRPRYPISLLWLAKLRLLEGKFQEAAEVLDEIMPEIPGNELAPVYRWQARLCLGLFEPALEDFAGLSHRRPETLWTPRPKDPWALSRAFDAIVERHAGDAWAYAWRGRILAGLEEPRDNAALADFNKALALEPGHPWAVLWRAEVIERLQGPRLAIPKFKAACGLKASSQSLGRLGRALVALGDLERGLENLENSLALNPDDNELRIVLGEALFKAGRPGQALEELTELRAAIVGTAEAHHWRAQALARLGCAAEALAAVETALRLRPGLAPARVLRARLLRHDGRLGEALEELAQVRGGRGGHG